MAKIRMKCSFTVYYTLEMEVSDDPEEQIHQLFDKVCNKHIFTSKQWDLENNPFWHHKNNFTENEIKLMNESLKQ